MNWLSKPPMGQELRQECQAGSLSGLREPQRVLVEREFQFKRRTPDARDSD